VGSKFEADSHAAICSNSIRANCKPDQVRIVDGPMARRAHQQLVALETKLRESGTVYKCSSGQHDDLGISCAMLAWAARHPHLEHWVGTALAARRPRRPQRGYGWGAFT
jgi:hypothetical protein